MVETHRIKCSGVDGLGSVGAGVDKGGAILADFLPVETAAVLGLRTIEGSVVRSVGSQGVKAVQRLTSCDGYIGRSGQS